MTFLGFNLEHLTGSNEAGAFNYEGRSYDVCLKSASRTETLGSAASEEKIGIIAKSEDFVSSLKKKYVAPTKCEEKINAGCGLFATTHSTSS